MVAEQITWGELGCPKAIGAYQLHGASVRVKNIHIIVAEDDPRAIFTVVTLRPPRVVGVLELDQAAAATPVAEALPFGIRHLGQ